jgi:hypothetical protein
MAVQDEGSALTARPALNFTGSSVTATDDAANNRTNVTIAGGSQTPWTSHINGAGFRLFNVDEVTTRIQTINENFHFYKFTAPADQKQWATEVKDSTLEFYCPNDAWDDTKPWLTVFRTGNTPTKAVFATQVENTSGGYKFPDGSVQTRAAAFRFGHTWALVGDVSALTTLPSMFVPLRAGQVCTLVGLRAKLGSGTSIGVQLKRNGSNLGSVITVTTTVATTAFSQALADNDELTFVLSSPSGTPTHLGMTLYLEHTP